MGSLDPDKDPDLQSKSGSGPTKIENLIFKFLDVLF
jgi:hypothetical protein